MKRIFAACLLLCALIGCSREPQGAGAGINGRDEGIADKTPETGARSGPSPKTNDPSSRP